MRNLIHDLLADTDAPCVEGAACPDDCDGECLPPTCPRCGVELGDPWAFTCEACAEVFVGYAGPAVEVVS